LFGCDGVAPLERLRLLFFLSASLGAIERVHPGLFGSSVRALEKPRVRKDQQLKCVLQAAQVTHVDHGQAVQFVEAGILEPEGEKEKEMCACVLFSTALS